MNGLSHTPSMIHSAYSQAAASSMARAEANIGAVSNDSHIKQAAMEFEQVFISQMLQHMFEGVNAPSLFGSGAGSTTYKKMLVDAYGKEMANAGGIGIADYMVAEFQRNQEIK